MFVGGLYCGIGANGGGWGATLASLCSMARAGFVMPAIALVCFIKLDESIIGAWVCGGFWLIISMSLRDGADDSLSKVLKKSNRLLKVFSLLG